MVEFGLVLAVIAGATLAVGRLRRRHPADFIVDNDVDLPCPWCLAQTAEDDTECPSCDEPFGVARG